MGDSMEKEKNKKKKATSANSKKSTGAKKVVAKSATTKKSVPAKKASADTTKKGVKPVGVEKQPIEKKAKPVNAVNLTATAKKKSAVVKEKGKESLTTKNELKSKEISKTEHGVKPAQSKEKLVLEKNELTNLIKIILIVTGIFLAFYLVTYLIAKNSSDNKETDADETEISVQYDEILMSNLLKQKNAEYYVLAYDAEDVYYNAYTTYLTSYTGKDNAIRVYNSILSNGFNDSYYDVDAVSNTNITSIEELKLNSSTLIKVKDGKIQAVYEGHDAIISYLKTLTA